jgi:hypothetical protein
LFHYHYINGTRKKLFCKKKERRKKGKKEGRKERKKEGKK